MTRVLVTAPVRDRAWALPSYLQQLEHMEAATPDCEIGYYFLVNDSSDESHGLLQEWREWREHDDVEIEVLNLGAADDKRWCRQEDGIYEHLSHVRDHIRERALELNCDYMLSVDTDIMVQPTTLARLLSHQLHFCAALISNAISGSFYSPNAIDITHVFVKPDIKPRYVVPKLMGLGPRVVGAFTGAVNLVSAYALQHGTYLHPIIGEPDIPAEDFGFHGEDLRFACSLWRHGVLQYVDEAHRCFHCLVPGRVEEYKAAYERFGPDCVRVLTEQQWLSDTRRGLVGQQAMKSWTNDDAAFAKRLGDVDAFSPY